MEKILTGLVTIISGLVLMTLLLGWPLMLLWNWLTPTIFGLPIITFWQAVGLNFLTGILFNKPTTKNN